MGPGALHGDRGVLEGLGGSHGARGLHGGRGFT